MKEILQDILRLIYEYIEHILSYFTAALALAGNLSLMQAGGGILLIARLVVDVPPAYSKIKSLFNK